MDQTSSRKKLQYPSSRSRERVAPNDGSQQHPTRKLDKSVLLEICRLAVYAAFACEMDGGGKVKKILERAGGGVRGADSSVSPWSNLRE